MACESLFSFLSGTEPLVVGKKDEDCHYVLERAAKSILFEILIIENACTTKARQEFCLAADTSAPQLTFRDPLFCFAVLMSLH